MTTKRTNGDETRRPAQGAPSQPGSFAAGEGPGRYASNQDWMRNGSFSSQSKRRPSVSERESGKAGTSGKAVPLAMIVLCGIIAAAILVYGTVIAKPVTVISTNNISVSQMTKGMKVLSSYTAVSASSNENRETNLDLAVESVNSRRVESGGTLSFNDAVGDVSNDTRFKAAPVDAYASDTVRGGGVNQVSTALYIAALEAGMEIVERSPYAEVQDYAPLGLDAAVSYGTKDLVFRNTSGNPVVVEATSSGSKVTVTLYGTSPSGGETYEATSQFVESYTEMEADETKTYYVSNSYLLCYRNGVCVERSLISTDTYTAAEGASVPVTKDVGDSQDSGN